MGKTVITACICLVAYFVLTVASDSNAPSLSETSTSTTSDSIESSSEAITSTTRHIIESSSETSTSTTSDSIESSSEAITSTTSHTIESSSEAITRATNNKITGLSGRSTSPTNGINRIPSPTITSITSNAIASSSATINSTTSNTITSSFDTITRIKSNTFASSSQTITSTTSDTIASFSVQSLSTTSSIVTRPSVTMPASRYSTDPKGETTSGSTPPVTNAVISAMKENAQFKIPFSLSVKKKFTKELKNRSSKIFLEYKNEFKRKILEAFSKGPGYIERIIIVNFTSGSVICNYEALFPATVETKQIIAYVNTTVKEALQNQTFMDASVNLTYLDHHMDAEVEEAEKKMSDRCNAENACPEGFSCLPNGTRDNLCVDMCQYLNCGKHGTCERSNSTVFCKCHQEAGTQYVYGGDRCQIKGEKLKLSSKYIAVIAGAVGGGVIFILVIALACTCFRNRRAKATRDGPLSAAGQSFSLEALDRRAGQGMEQNETNLSRYPNPNGNIYSPMQTGPHELDKEDSSLYNGYGQQPRLPYNNLEMSRTRGYTLDEGRNSALMYFPSPGLPKVGIGLGNRTSYTGEPKQVQQPDYTSFGKNSDDRDLVDGQKVYRQESFQLPRLTAKPISEPPAEDRINESNYTYIDRPRDESRGSFYNRGNDGRERFESVIRPDKPPRSIENRGKIEEPEVRRYRHDETSSTHSGHKQSSVAMTVDYYNPRADYDDIDDDRRLLDDFEQRRQHAGIRNNAYVAGVDERRAESRTRPSQRAHHGNEQYYRGSRDR